jgi:putative intracellular protease/amidase
MFLKTNNWILSVVKLLLLIAIQFAFSTNLKADTATSKSKVLFVLSAHETGYWLPEVIKPYKDLTDNGYLVEFASPGGASGFPKARHQLSSTFRETYQQIVPQISNPMALKNVDSHGYRAIYFPGGAGPMFDLQGHPEVNRLVKEFYKDKKIISALCHGPAALTFVTLDNGKNLISGMKITGKSNAEESSWARQNYPFLIEDKFKSLNSIYTSAKPKGIHVVYDFPLLTGQNPQSTDLLSQKLVQLLLTNKAS